MKKFIVELVKYDTVKTKKRKRKDLVVNEKTEEAVIEKLEKIHKGDKVENIFEITWKEEVIEEESSALFTGTVKFFEKEKGFGFIRPDIDEEDLFFHASALNGQVINDHDKVEFEMSKGPKGLIAIHIKRID